MTKGGLLLIYDFISIILTKSENILIKPFVMEKENL